MTIMKKKCNKWTLVFLFYSLFIFNNLYKTAVNAAPEKLTPEEVLEELGVKIETKGKTIFFSNIFLSFKSQTLVILIRLQPE
jgi:hypothetical protein